MGRMNWWVLLVGLTLSPLGSAMAGCLPESVTGTWQVTSQTKWVSCLGSRCKHGNENSSYEVDYLTEPSEIIDSITVQCWPSSSGLWATGIRPFVSWSSGEGPRCTARIAERDALVEQLRSCGEDSSIALVALTSSVQSKRGGRKVVSSATVRFSLDNSAGHVVVRTTSRRRWTQSE